MTGKAHQIQKRGFFRSKFFTESRSGSRPRCLAWVPFFFGVENAQAELDFDLLYAQFDLDFGARHAHEDRDVIFLKAQFDIFQP